MFVCSCWRAGCIQLSNTCRTCGLALHAYYMCVCVSTYCTCLGLCGVGAKSSVAPPGSGASLRSRFFSIALLLVPSYLLSLSGSLSWFPGLLPWQQERIAGQEISGSQAVTPVQHCGVQSDTLVLVSVCVFCMGLLPDNQTMQISPADLLLAV